MTEGAPHCPSPTRPLSPSTSDNDDLDTTLPMPPFAPLSLQQTPDAFSLCPTKDPRHLEEAPLLLALSSPPAPPSTTPDPDPDAGSSSSALISASQSQRDALAAMAQHLIEHRTAEANAWRLRAQEVTSDATAAVAQLRVERSKRTAAEHSAHSAHSRLDRLTQRLEDAGTVNRYVLSYPFFCHQI